MRATKAKLQERTCCVCRSKGDKRLLARLVGCKGALVWDVAQRAPGRGAYVHLATECLSKMGSSSRWEHVLKLSPGSLDGAQVSEVTRSMMQEVHRGFAGRLDDKKNGLLGSRRRKML
jgi:predicted RNA-binding protein YlxR (DUF448 family)